MGDVKRYNLEDYLGLQIVHEQEDGKFVLYEDHRAVIESIINDEAVLGDHNLIPSYKAEVAALLARHAALVEACQALLGAYSNGEFEPSMRLPLVVRESALKIAKIANAKVARLLEDK